MKPLRGGEVGEKWSTMHQLDTQAAAMLRDYIPGDEWIYPLADGELRVILAPLPGRAVVGVARTDTTLWVVLDTTKPAARQHLLELIDQWPLGDHDERPAHGLTITDAVALLTPFPAAEVDGYSTAV